ncbi:hypothetical protein DPMN_043052 [Dreissena polymorpha]|uniref:Uncharacterized protein n=1 Tax=Dreissena polymorpha TaxID=45954 RepID=A0A9D4CZR6_DREPO|nr:hypothetical protein DPMN_043052 [Dreissena polymorpha]
MLSDVAAFVCGVIVKDGPQHPPACGGLFQSCCYLRQEGLPFDIVSPHKECHQISLIFMCQRIIPVLWSAGNLVTHQKSESLSGRSRK